MLRWAVKAAAAVAAVVGVAELLRRLTRDAEHASLSGLFDHGARKSFARATGASPGEDEPEIE